MLCPQQTTFLICVLYLNLIRVDYHKNNTISNDDHKFLNIFLELYYYRVVLTRNDKMNIINLYSIPTEALFYI